MGEFDLIERYFLSAAKTHGRVDIGIGDDCALLTPAPGMQLAVSSDMLVEGQHFLSTVNPEALGHKALAVNLSDLAACGAQPLAFTLALSMPRVDEAWLAGFSKGLLALADSHGCALVGGDTTAGPLTICITIFGQIPQGQGLLRSGAREGDEIYVSGWPGQARMALEVFRGTLSLPEEGFAQMRARMERPQPRVALGLALRGLATSCIDISDGLLGDLGHILKASQLGAEIQLDAIDSIAKESINIPGSSHFSLKMGREMVLAGGDDYELLFTAAPAQRETLRKLSAQLQLPLKRIGVMQQRRPEQGAVLLREVSGEMAQQAYASFDHFK
jgi:thiamine-monophosphate kinase